MASKKDLIDAQTYSRRRLLAAFTSGAPGGKEVEPSSSLKSVIGGVVLAAMVLVAGVFWGFIKPTLEPGWETNTLVMVGDTGARYLSVDGTLHPVQNATSARLLVPADQYSVVSVDSAEIAEIPVGPGIGIVGAPDDVPAADALVPSGWTACPVPGGTAVAMPGDPAAAPTSAGTVVTNGSATYVVAGGLRFAVAPADADAVLRAVGLAESTPIEVDSRWLNLFEEGAPLEPLTVEQAGEPIGTETLVVGAVVHPQGSTNRFLVTPQGELAAISPFAVQLYLLGTGDLLGGEREVTQGEIAQLPTAATVAGGADWPTDLLDPMGVEEAPCALLQHDAAGAPETTLAATTDLPQAPGVSVAVRAGALAQTGGRGDEGLEGLVLVDESGTAYALPGADAAVLSRLGYDAQENATRVPDVWMQFFAAGPALTVDAAGTTPSGESLETPDASPSPTAVAEAPIAVDAVALECEPGVVEYAENEPDALSMLQARDAWTRSAGAGVVIAVVDSGIDADNAHLRDAVVGGVDLVGDGEREDGLSDLHGHGTAIAGQIAAREVDGSGVVGLAPESTLLSVRVFRGTDEESVEAGHGPDAARLAEGIRWAVANGADVISVSLSDDQDVPAVRTAVDAAVEQGVLIVASAGNRNTASEARDEPRYPAAYDGVLAVAATDPGGRVTDDSIHGPHVDVAAPGQNVLTATTGGGDCLYSQDAPSTSYATGYTAAAAALVMSAHPDDDVSQVQYRLQASALRANADARDDDSGWGAIQPYDAIVMVPGADQRGPLNPFTGERPDAVVPAGVRLEPVQVVSPLEDTRSLALGVGVVGGLALAAVGMGVAMRRRAEAPEPSVDDREGMLDSKREASTRMLG